MLDLDVPRLVAYNPGIAMMGECPRAPGYRAEYPLYRFFGSNQAIAQAVLVRLPYKLNAPTHICITQAKERSKSAQGKRNYSPNGPEKRNIQGPVGPIKY